MTSKFNLNTGENNWTNVMNISIELKNLFNYVVNKNLVNYVRKNDSACAVLFVGST